MSYQDEWVGVRVNKFYIMKKTGSVTTQIDQNALSCP